MKTAGAAAQQEPSTVVTRCSSRLQGRPFRVSHFFQFNGEGLRPILGHSSGRNKENEEKGEKIALYHAIKISRVHIKAADYYVCRYL